MNNTIITSILRSKEDFERTESLRKLVKELQNLQDFIIPSELKTFLETYKTEDKTQAALVGIALWLSKHQPKPSLDILVRLFPALKMDWEPEICQYARTIFSALSPKEIYNKLVDIVSLEKGDTVEQYYAYNVISTIDFDTLTEDMKDYLQ